MVSANCFADPNPDRSPLYDVRKHAGRVHPDSDMRIDVSRTILWFGVRPVSALSGCDAAAFFDRLAEPKLAPASEGWWSQTGSNRRPHACKARALPAELWPRNQKTNAPHSIKVVGLGRLELPTSRLSSARSNQLSYKPLTLLLRRRIGAQLARNQRQPEASHKR